MSIKTMKQALEALERGRSQIIGALVQQDQDDAITSLRQAIAEAEKQEPVAWLQLTAYGDKLLSFNKPSEEKVHYYTSLKLHDPKNIPLYTHPQPKLRGKNT